MSKQKKIQRFDIAQLYKEVFGLGFMRIRPMRLEEPAPRVDLNNLNLTSSAELPTELLSYMGTPIHLPLTLEDFRLPNEPLITLTVSKRIVETELDSMDGTFKEEFALGDYEINIKGILIDEANPDQLPENLIRNLRRIVEKKGALKCSNKLLSYFNIDRLVIYSCTFPETVGSLEMVPYELTCKSDKEWDLELKNIGNG